MATPETSQSFPGAAADTVALDRFKCIFRTCWRKPAGWRQPWRDDAFVDANCQQADCLSQRYFHCVVPSSDTSSARNSSSVLSPAERRGFNTTSKPEGSNRSEVRMISRTLLLIRFRSCAAPSLRGVVKPKRLRSRPLSFVKTTKEREVFFAPLS
jgi:hypothetical protein